MEPLEDGLIEGRPAMGGDEERGDAGNGGFAKLFERHPFDAGKDERTGGRFVDRHRMLGRILRQQFVPQSRQGPWSRLAALQRMVAGHADLPEDETGGRVPPAAVENKIRGLESM